MIQIDLMPFLCSLLISETSDVDCLHPFLLCQTYIIFVKTFTVDCPTKLLSSSSFSPSSSPWSWSPSLCALLITESSHIDRDQCHHWHHHQDIRQMCMLAGRWNYEATHNTMRKGGWQWEMLVVTKAFNISSWSSRRFHSEKHHKEANMPIYIVHLWSTKTSQFQLWHQIDVAMNQ